ncbi:DUF317 domain-containing protein [Streptomyces sp. NPDC058155]|uniref:DUF317 domain-containing protein n=1 Tax=Streptomyces sp. NPDC058155 TaxID=3346359 RepID=UPI0036F19365
MPTDLDSFGPDDPVLVSPRYLAGPRLEQRPLAAAMVWSSLMKAGWATYTLDNQREPLLCASPCQLVRAARMPNATDGGWKTVVYEDPLAAPWWTAEWTQQTPAELLTDFHRALAEAHALGALHSLTSPAAAVYLPLLNAGWSHTVDERGNQMFTAPDRFATVTGHRRPSHGSDAWSLSVFPGTTGVCRWSARFSKQVPNALVAAFTASLADTTPVYRTAGQLPKELHSHLVTEPAPPCAPGRSEAGAASAPVLPTAGPGQSTARRL